MKVVYDRETDTLTIVFADAPVAESDEVRDGLVVDYDSEGRIVSVEVLEASRHISRPGSIDFEVGEPALPRAISCTFCDAPEPMGQVPTMEEVRAQDQRSAITRDEVLRTLREHRDEWQRLGVKSLGLFGSAARDEAGVESDVDVLVEFEGRATFDGYMSVKELLAGLLGRRVDLVTRKALKPRLKARIEQEAIYVS